VDISSSADPPAGLLSNFAAHTFVFDGEQAASMEGFLQSLKFADPEKAVAVRSLVGRAAKWKGSRRNFAWKQARSLWWKGQPIDRFGDDYQRLLDGAFHALFDQNTEARRALLATGDANLTHARGSSDPQESILTESEFCERLMRIRNELR